jgi:hypothetical protein
METSRFREGRTDRNGRYVGRMARQGASCLMQKIDSRVRSWPMVRAWMRHAGYRARKRSPCAVSSAFLGYRRPITQPTSKRPRALAMWPAPPFPDFVSGHSAYSAAAAEILRLWTGSDRFGDSVTMAAGSSKIEPGVTPARAVTLHWGTFSDAANEAGMSRRYGGINFRTADVAGRRLGRVVAANDWEKAQGLSREVRIECDTAKS